VDLVFFGTGEFASPSLETLTSAQEHKILAVVTQPDRPSGRKLKLAPSAVKKIALERHLPILQPARINTSLFIETLTGLRPQLIVVIAYGQILGREILDMPGRGCVNVHGSLLPKYRGASPIQSALLQGETVTGVTTMFMDEGLDTGDIILQERSLIEPDDNAALLEKRLAEIGASLLLETVRLIGLGKAPRRQQDDSQATICKKFKKSDGQIDWTLPARDLYNRVRAFNPWPSAFTYLPMARGLKQIKIWKAEVIAGNGHQPGTIVRVHTDGIVVAAGREHLLIKEMQIEGGRRLQAAQFVAGYKISAGTAFQNPPTGS
jgi:methionyl-tRNA formyltransferase